MALFSLPLQRALKTCSLGYFSYRRDVEASYHHLLVATYRIDPILRCEHHDAIREKERICWKRERGGAHFDYTSGRDIFRYTPKLAWKETLTASGEHITHLHERGWYLRMPTIRRILPTPTMQCTNAVITASAVKKWGQARAWIMESWWKIYQGIFQPKNDVIDYRARS